MEHVERNLILVPFVNDIPVIMHRSVAEKGRPHKSGDSGWVENTMYQ